MNTVNAAESAQPYSSSDFVVATGELFAEQEEHADESFEATIIRLDTLSLERLFRLAEER